MSESGWQDFDLAQIVERAEAQEAPYLEFLRVPQLSCGIYSLTAGSSDTQTTHDEDEVYCVLKGRATVRLGDEVKHLGPGSILYIPADRDHAFTEILEDLSLLVFFGSGGPSGARV